MNKNYGLQQYFLDYIKEQAGGKLIDNKFVYSRLIGFNVRYDQEPYADVDYMFNDWLSRYQNNKNISCIYDKENPYFLWFMRGNLKGNEIKLYIPQDKSHLKESGNQIFDFLAQSGIEHQSKIACKIRNDNIVIRVNTLEDAKRIIDFVSRNQYLQEGLIKTNPFVANYNGVGLAMDNNFSYNSTLSDIIYNFHNYLAERNMLNEFTVQNLNNYIVHMLPAIQDLNKKDIYTLISKTTRPDFKIEDFIEHARDKATDKYMSDRQRVVDPGMYLEDLILKNEAYYPGNAKHAIKNYMDFDATCFTRKDNIRKSLLRHVHPSDLVPIMRKKLSDNGIPFPNTDVELIDSYLKIISLNKSKISTEDPFEIIKKAYYNTLSVYGHNQARGAMEALITNGYLENFTNRMGDRAKLQRLGNVDFKRIILSHIDINDLNSENISEIINRFEDTLGIRALKNAKER